MWAVWVILYLHPRASTLHAPPPGAPGLSNVSADSRSLSLPAPSSSEPSVPLPHASWSPAAVTLASGQMPRCFLRSQTLPEPVQTETPNAAGTHSLACVLPPGPLCLELSPVCFSIAVSPGTMRKEKVWKQEGGVSPAPGPAGRWGQQQLLITWGCGLPHPAFSYKLLYTHTCTHTHTHSSPLPQGCFNIYLFLIVSPCTHGSPTLSILFT